VTRKIDIEGLIEISMEGEEIQRPSFFLLVTRPKKADERGGVNGGQISNSNDLLQQLTRQNAFQKIKKYWGHTKIWEGSLDPSNTYNIQFGGADKTFWDRH